MLVRSIIGSAILGVFGGLLFAQETTSSLTVGNHFSLRMTGELAKEYATRCGFPSVNSEHQFIETSAMISQILSNGQIRIEHSGPVVSKSGKSRMVTINSIVDPTKFTTTIVKANTATYASPADAKNGVAPAFIKIDKAQVGLELSEMKGLKLPTWELAEEIGDIPHP